MLTIPLYGHLYIGYAYRKSTGVEICHLTLKGHSQGQWSRSLELVTCQIEATIAWNMMIKSLIFGSTLTNGVKLKL